MRDHLALLDAYVQSVITDARPACKWERLACERHLQDLARADLNEEDFPFVFNPELTLPPPDPAHPELLGKPYRPAQRVCQFAELLPHIKGDWAARGECIRLEGWQIFILASIFGWVHRETGKRRFRKADLLVPRKNAKSTIAAVVGLYMLGADGEFGAEVYSGATSKDQAHEVFRPARLMAQSTPEYRKRFGVLVNVSNLAVLDTNSKFEPLIGKPGDGASPSCAIVDEYHEHPTSELYDTMATGMGARSQPLLVMITTAGTNIGGPCFSHQVELQKILQGIVLNDRRFGIIFGLDSGDDWTDPAALLKANPNLGVSIDEEMLRADQLEAKADPRKAAIFRTKRLNVWVNSANPWLNLESLQASNDVPANLDDFRGAPCYVGLDLASKTDIASKASVFTRELPDGRHYYVFTRNWLPEAAVNKPENEHYRAWVAQNHIVQTSGNMIDLRLIQDDVEADAERFRIAEVAMDAWGSREIAPALQQSGFAVIDVPMTTRNLSEPMKLIAGLVDGGRLHIDGNLATLWMFSNVECVADRNENLFPRKAKPELKIDAAVATILAVGRAMANEQQAAPEFFTLDLAA